MIIKTIEVDLTYSIRHEVLRPNQTLNDCKYPLDMESETIHLGAFMDGRLISIASYFHEQHPNLKAEHQYRLRGMATLPEYRNLRAGSSLVKKAEKLMIEKNTELWWCNARTTVSDYYLKLGLKIMGDVFDIDPIGPHVLMYKSVKNSSVP